MREKGELVLIPHLKKGAPTLMSHRVWPISRSHLLLNMERIFTFDNCSGSSLTKCVPCEWNGSIQLSALQLNTPSTRWPVVVKREMRGVGSACGRTSEPTRSSITYSGIRGGHLRPNFPFRSIPRPSMATADIRSERRIEDRNSSSPSVRLRSGDGVPGTRNWSSIPELD
jgi:hypothetical protein